MAIFLVRETQESWKLWTVLSYCETCAAFLSLKGMRTSELASVSLIQPPALLWTVVTLVSSISVALPVPPVLSTWQPTMAVLFHSLGTWAGSPWVFLTLRNTPCWPLGAFLGSRVVSQFAFTVLIHGQWHCAECYGFLLQAGKLPESPQNLSPTQTLG